MGKAKPLRSRRLGFNLLRRLGGSLALPAHPSELSGHFLYSSFQIFVGSFAP
jgi:hypothetical protein